MSDLTKIPREHWQALTTSTIYFGHQSVGNNIIEATRDLLRENPHIPLRVVSGPDTPASGVLHEFYIGENGDVASKNAGFLSAVQRPLGSHPILMFKYCYVDIDIGTDVQQVFRQYQETVQEVRAKHPEATIVHVTVPLVTHSVFRDSINGLLGRPTRPMRNALRTRYNELLRRAYAGKEPIYDLAAVESTRADGSSEHVILDGRPVYALAPDWTSDGGHLNAQGRRRAAEQLLITLAALPAQKNHP